MDTDRTSGSIRQDQADTADESRWLRELDASIARSLAEMEAGGGIDLDAACDAVIAELKASGDKARA